MTVSAEFPRSETEKPTDEILVEYLARRQGLGWEDIAHRMPDVPRELIKEIVLHPERTTAAGERGISDRGR